MYRSVSLKIIDESFQNAVRIGRFDFFYRIIVAIVDAFHFNTVERTDHEPPEKRSKMTCPENSAEEKDENEIDESSVSGGEDGPQNNISEKGDGHDDGGSRPVMSIHRKVIDHLLPRLNDCAVGKVCMFFSMLHN